MNTGLEIILIEDNVDDAALVIRALKKNNLANKMIHLKDGAEALEFFFGKDDKNPELPNVAAKVVLLDLKMPKINGMEVLERVKSDPRTKQIPIVVLTSSAEDPDIKRCYELGANSYIVKPVEFDNFSKAVADLGMYWLILNNPPTV
ncbi:MAG: response regulator [Bacteroidota bacterium]|jgi:two-component system response regulator|nr:response regulator [Bacteroidota bacterium]